MEGLAQLGDRDFRCCKETFEATASIPLEIPGEKHVRLLDHGAKVKESAVALLVRVLWASQAPPSP